MHACRSGRSPDQSKHYMFACMHTYQELETYVSSENQIQNSFLKYANMLNIHSH
jgi:hypothetical protein